MGEWRPVGGWVVGLIDRLWWLRLVFLAPDAAFGDFARTCAGTLRLIARVRGRVVGWGEGVVSRLIPVARRISGVKGGPRRPTFFRRPKKSEPLTPEIRRAATAWAFRRRERVDAPERKKLGEAQVAARTAAFASRQDLGRRDAVGEEEADAVGVESDLKLAAHTTELEQLRAGINHCRRAEAVLRGTDAGC